MTDCISHFDESDDKKFFVAGGLTATAERWNALEQEWTVALALSPAIPYFKFNNFHKLSAADHGAKIDALIAVINKHVMRGDAGLVDVPAYKAHFENLIGAGYKKPAHFAYVQTLQQCALECPEKEGRIGFVFDTMDELQMADLQYAFGLFKEICPNAEVKARLDKEPQCGDDKTVPALQAADLWAGLIRASAIPDLAAMAYLRKITIPNRAFLWDGKNLAEIVRKSEERTPGIASGMHYEQPAQRKKRLKKFIFGRKDKG